MSCQLSVDGVSKSITLRMFRSVGADLMIKGLTDGIRPRLGIEFNKCLK